VKFLFLYGLGLASAWVGLVSLLAGLEAWPRDGAPVPVAAGVMILLVAVRLLLGLVRLYRPPAGNRGRTFSA
jgi:hypothetical protein